MIVSVDWLREYVAADMPLDKLTHQLTMSGLNLEDIAPAGDDTAIDLEVTSNRSDCLGHIGVAREIGVLFAQELSIPDAKLPHGEGAVADVTSVQIECEDACPQYTARVIKGVKIGPSPEWLVKRLEAAHWDYKEGKSKYKSINNVVDITNYVMLECGQPLHAFDFDKLGEDRIVVRNAKKGEKITAIDQREYELDEQMCVICDAEKPVAIGGVMGGLESEISEGTTDVLVEAAAFAPLSIRRTARKLKLFSPSSYRFERTVDRRQIDWASRRCCELILQIAGGTLVEGVAVAGSEAPEKREPVKLRFSQVPRIVGVDVSAAEQTKILNDLGLATVEVSEAEALFEPPSWRRDLSRECDLVEEVARIHGYENIPDDANLAVVATAKSKQDRVTDRVRDTLIALGFFDCVTLSFVSADQTQQFNPRGLSSFVSVDHSTRQKENVLRASLVPSLLACRRDNERHGTANAELFEIARVYLAADSTAEEVQVEPLTISGVCGRPFLGGGEDDIRGVVETLAKSLNRSAIVTARPSELGQFEAGRGAEILLNGEHWGWAGELSSDVVSATQLRDGVSAFELTLEPLIQIAELEPRFSALPAFPSVARDLNFVLDESVTWEQLSGCVTAHGGDLLDSVSFAGQYRGKGIESGRKSYVLTNRFRSAERTLTSDEVELAQQAIVAACESQLGATLRA
ncbi:MAG: phenylalanine--tRNA ligase subunit beta [Planctomycetaceae bacterium]